jgi:hypothetical protein
MPNIMTMQCAAGMAQNYPISLPGYAFSGSAAVTSAGALRSAVRRDLGTDFPQQLDVGYFLAPALPGGVAAGGSFLMPLAPSCGAPHVACSITLTQPGQLVLSRYLDALGTILSSTATQAATANVACVLDASSSSIFESWSLQINNTSASAATLSSFAAVLARS